MTTVVDRSSSEVHFGDVKSVGAGMQQVRFDWAKGWRVPDKPFPLRKSEA